MSNVRKIPTFLPTTCVAFSVLILQEKVTTFLPCSTHHLSFSKTTKILAQMVAIKRKKNSNGKKSPGAGCKREGREGERERERD